MTPLVVPFVSLVPAIIFLPCLRQRTTHLFGNHACELRPVINDHLLGQSSVPLQVIQRSDHTASRQARIDLYGDAFTSVAVDYVERSKTPSIEEAVRHEIHCPDGIWRCRSCCRLTGPPKPSSYFALYLKRVKATQSADSFIVYLVTFPAKKDTQPSIAEPTMFES